MTALPEESATAPITRMELAISTLLRGGIILSLFTVLAGVIVMFAHHPEYAHSREVLSYLKSADYKFPFTAGGVVLGVMQGEGRSIVLLGVFILFLTPLFRVVASVIAFAISKDWAFTAITFAVLCVIGLSLILGRAG
jgi:uncharacterized membrane protein